MLDAMSDTSVSASHRRLVFPAKQQVLLETFEPGQPKAGEVLVRTRFSLMSTGTENIVFNRLFDPGTGWDSWVKYPFYPGYATVGTVEKLGPGVTSLRVGDRVAYRVPHSSHAVLPAASCFPIPAGISFEAAAWFPLAKIAFFGARAAGYVLGDSVLIIGAGPIGQMSIRWARANGVAKILIVDAVPDRMKTALAGGATTTIVAPIDQARDAVLQAMGGQLPRVVLDGTGNAVVFAAALGLAAQAGRVVILGDTGTPAKQSLTSDVLRKGLTVIGAHDTHNTDEWNDATVTQLFFTLAATGRFPLDGLTSHTFQPEQCSEAYATANRDRAKTMGILFDWSN
jgi:2-desacetyl-2-hydroxyethyl bacteriochlorophyllide A dehydrogenase